MERPEALAGYDVSRETLAKLQVLADELGRWQAIKNLVGPGFLRWRTKRAASARRPRRSTSARRWRPSASGC
jgi:hypothetical protein